MDICARLNYNAVMATKQPTKKPSTKTKKTSVSTSKKTTVKRAATKKRAVVPASHKVDFYPNRMTVAVSALAGSVLVLVTLIAVLGSR